MCDWRAARGEDLGAVVTGAGGAASRRRGVADAPLRTVRRGCGRERILSALRWLELHLAHGVSRRVADGVWRWLALRNDDVDGRRARRHWPAAGSLGNGV